MTVALAALVSTGAASGAESHDAPALPPAPPAAPAPSGPLRAPAPLPASTPGPIDADTQAPKSPKPRPPRDRQRVILGADLSTLLGQGTFVENDGARNEYFAWFLTLRPLYKPTKATNVFAFLNLSQELTDAEPTSDARNRRLLLSDLLLGARHRFLTLESTGTSFDIGAIVRTPTSIASQYDSLYFAVRPGLGLTQPLGKQVVVLARTEFRKNFHEYTSPVGDASSVGDDVFLARQGGNERLGPFLVSPGGNNLDYEFWNRLLVSYSPVPHVGLGALLIAINGFTYEDFPVDERSGVGAKAGRGQRDVVYAELNGSYSWGSTYTLTGGIITQGPVATADGTGVRFPLFDFTSTAQNFSSFFLRFSVNYSVVGGGAQQRKVAPNVAQRLPPRQPHAQVPTTATPAGPRRSAAASSGTF